MTRNRRTDAFMSWEDLYRDIQPKYVIAQAEIERLKRELGIARTFIVRTQFSTDSTIGIQAMAALEDMASIEDEAIMEKG